MNSTPKYYWYKRAPSKIHFNIMKVDGIKKGEEKRVGVIGWEQS